jgi:UDP-N-acetylglucosamine/UDP-N-acetylgalactosamine 4-epimerase
MSAYDRIQKKLRARPATWLVTGCGGFIGSHLIEKLLFLGQKVVGLDNLSTGHKRNLSEVERLVGGGAWRNFRFIRGDIRESEICRKACEGVEYVLHQAALGSVPRSMEDPLTTHACNVTGFLNMLLAAQQCKVKRVVYASSSAVYGDEGGLPKVEEKIGRPLSPYAATKYTNEVYADVFERCYGLECIGLRYFNVFGPRQDPNGPYAAVIPKWIAAMENGEEVCINGDGLTSRDFCYVANVVQANILAATSILRSKNPVKVFNIACNEQVSLNELFLAIREILLPHYPKLHRVKPKYKGFRAGDVRHSLAAISKAQLELGYAPTHTFAEGIRQTCSGLVGGASQASGRKRQFRA